MRIILLGATGMLGQAVFKTASSMGLEVEAVGLSPRKPFRYPNDSLEQVLESVSVKKTDLLVNCIGWIPQKAHGTTEMQLDQARSLNENLLAEISRLQEAIKFRWLQIATDCVFSGQRGPYLESDLKDAADIYGRSKIAGEVFCDNAYLVRCSIVGPDTTPGARGLFEWFKRLPLGSVVNGYTNALWNGVTTWQFANLSVGLLSETGLEAFSTHFVPEGFLTKFEILANFKELLGRDDIVIRASSGPMIDRRLATENSARNNWLWQKAGFESIPNVNGSLLTMRID